MTELERTLRTLSIAFPETPELAPRVAARIAGRRRVPRRLVLAFAVLALALAVAMAVPPARSAILRVFGIGGVTIEFVDELPPVSPRGALALGNETTLAGAQSELRYRLSTSDLLGKPDHVYLLGQRVWFLYGDERKPRVLVTQFPGLTDPGLAKKLISGGTRIEFVEVESGVPGYWITGAPHELLVLDELGNVIPESVRLAGDTLLWTRDGTTLRIEGRMSRGQALRIARSLEPR
jgi:hypothetical protein